MQFLVVIPATLAGIGIFILQLTAYYSVYLEHGIISLSTIGEIFLMTVFPPYAWYVAAEFLEFI